MITNLAAYKFAPLTDLKPLRERLKAFCKSLELKGTILLSPEGINLFIAGQRDSVERLLTEVKTLPGCEELEPKFSESASQPFTRMLVRIKKEIIAFGVEGINPQARTSPKLAPKTLKKWLDEGRPITLLDTRNDYEVKLGTFKNALPLHIDHFRDFPEAVRRLPPQMKEQPIVMFCTGGIRCEKAGPFMENEGFSQIFQLDGGILKYFEHCGHEHYEGECFVFDHRVGVDPRLSETDSALCFVCQTPLSRADQQDPRFVPAKSCPTCYVTPEQAMARLLARRNEAILRVSTPLPASQPYDNLRPLHVPALYDRATLLDFLCNIFKHHPREEWLAKFDQGLIQNQSGQAVRPEQVIRAGERYLHRIPSMQEPEVNAQIRVLYEDEALFVLHKPAPLPMHASGRFNRNTLQYILEAAYAPERPRPAHRLDANTTGLIVCARTRAYANLLQSQFARGEIDKLYLARVRGTIPLPVFTCDAPISVEPTSVGARVVDEEAGLAARTEFRHLETFEDHTTLLEVRPLTGRTNQIRIHLWKLGLPICGDATYLAGDLLGGTQTLPVEAPPLCLHAWKLAFTHPIHKQRVSFEDERPVWANHSDRLLD